jgi:hypothetical protein
MARDFEGQLSFDWSQSVAQPVNIQVILTSEISPAAEVLCLRTHRHRRDEAERSHHFSEILKLVEHLNN